MVKSGSVRSLCQRLHVSVPDGHSPKPSGDPEGVGRGVFFVQEPLDPRLNIPVCEDLVRSP